MAEELLAVDAVSLHQRFRVVGNAVSAREEALVGGQEALLVQEVLIVVVVKHVGGVDVEHGGLVAVPAGAEALQVDGHGGVQRRVGRTCGGRQPVAEQRAPGSPDCVGSY